MPDEQGSGSRGNRWAALAWRDVPRILGALLVLLGGVDASPALARPKTDQVVLRNNDLLSCVIKHLQRGQLTVQTDYMGTVDIDWLEVNGITSTHSFQIELEDGLRVAGILQSAEPGELRVLTGSDVMQFDQDEIVRITPIEAGFLDRINGSIDIGFSYAQSNAATQWSVGAQAERRELSSSQKISLTSAFSSQQGADDVSRHLLSLSNDRYFSQRWFVAVRAQAEQNQELQLNLRATAGGGIGRNFVQTNTMVLAVLVGTIYAREQYETAEANSVQGLIGAGIDYFQFGNRETQLGAQALVLPSFTEKGRVRVELDGDVSRELTHDFYVQLATYLSYDTGLEGADSSQSDWGVTWSIGWKF